MQVRRFAVVAGLVSLLFVGITLTAPSVSAAPLTPRAPAVSGPIAGGYARVTADSLRLRAGPGTGYAILMSVNKGQVVHVLSGPVTGSWFRATYHGVTGYMSGAWLANSGLAGAGLATHFSRLVVVSLARQQLEAYQSGRLILVTAITTGQPALATPTGLTTVMAKRSPFTFISPWPPGSPFWYAPSPVHEAILFRSGGYYLHDAPWRPYYGFGTSVMHRDPDGIWRTGSHGCVNLPLWAEQQLYAWITLGTPVQVVSW